MYLKYVRHKRLYGALQRGTLYHVHIEPNGRGKYHEVLTSISDVYELSLDAAPAALIYPVGLRRIDGRYRLAFGHCCRYSMLHLIDVHACELFFTNLHRALQEREEVRIEVCQAERRM